MVASLLCLFPLLYRRKALNYTSESTMKKNRMIIQFRYVALVLFGVIFISILRSPRASALNIEGKWLDRAHIQIDKIEFEQKDLNSIGIDALNTTNNDLATLNKDAQSAVGVYTDLDIETSDGQHSYGKTADGCDGVSNINATSEQIAQNTLQFNALIVKNNDPTKTTKCFPIIAPAVFLSTNIKLSNEDNRRIWFNYVDDGKKQIIRVDQKDGNFNVLKEPTKYYSSQSENTCGENKAYVERKGDISDRTEAKYETCGSAGIIDNILIAKGSPGDPGGKPATAISGGDSAKSCQSNNPLDMAWWACGMLGMIDSGLESATTALASLLSVNAEDFASQQLYTVWSYFRAVASFLLIGTALVMIIGQALSGD